MFVWSVPHHVIGIFVFFRRYLCVHVCEVHLRVLCKCWDMSLFVCEIRVSAICVVCLNVVVYGWVSLCFCLFLYCVHPLHRGRPAEFPG